MKPPPRKEPPEKTGAHQDAGVIAGETEVPIGGVIGEFPAEHDTSKRERESSTGKFAFLVGAGILLSRVVGVIRQRVFAHYFGTSTAADAFNAAFRIPNFLQNIFGEGALSASFIPVYAGLLARKSKVEADRVASAILTLLALVTSVVVLAGVLMTPYLVTLIAPGFKGATHDLAERLVQILFPGAGLLVMSAWCLGVLNSHRKFFLAYTAPVIWNVAIIVSLIWFGERAGGAEAPDLGMFQFRLAEIAAWGSVVGSALQFGIQLPTVVRLVRHLRPVLEVKSKNVRFVIRNFFPVFISRGVVQISAFVDSLLASLLGTGAVAALTFAQSLYTLPVSLFGMSVSAAELPVMSSALGSDEDIQSQLRTRLDSGLRRIAFLIVPSAIGFLALGDVMAAALYQTGRFTRADSIYVWGILAGSAIGLLPTTLGRLYASAYYALHDTRTPLRYATVHVAIAVVFGYLFAIPVTTALGIDLRWGVIGLTTAAGLGGWAEFLFLRRSLNKRIGRTGLPLAFVLKLWAAAAAAAGIGWAIKLGLAMDRPILRAIAVLGPYGVSYFALTSIFGLPEARTFAGRIQRILRRR